MLHVVLHHSKKNCQQHIVRTNKLNNAHYTLKAIWYYGYHLLRGWVVSGLGRCCVWWHHWLRNLLSHLLWRVCAFPVFKSVMLLVKRLFDYMRQNLCFRLVSINKLIPWGVFVDVWWWHPWMGFPHGMAGAVWFFV